ncbi:MAG: SRPBCC domain-containing protein [Sphingobacteriales bacterium]|nr:MAG: SRPBCC domain-containing protein [Sphingobacteriales bacterium]
MDAQAYTTAVFSKTIAINAPAKLVWAALTEPHLMKQWMSPDNPLEIITDWTIDRPIFMRGSHYDMPFENYGMVLQCQPNVLLSYTHLSSVSNLADVAESYSILSFALAEEEGETMLTFNIRNFPTDAIYRHLAFYWNVTLEVLKRVVEGAVQL